MRLLVLGGTQFIGRHLVEAALARGHDVTLFHRGEHGAELFPGVERIRGDRKADLSALRGRRWDAVVDTSAYVPRVARASAEALADSVGLYLFVSTISVYASGGPLPIPEDAPVWEMEDADAEEATAQTYGGLKVLCERVVEGVFPGRTLVVRPGMSVGPHDHTDRFPYWVRRVAEGGEVLAPGRPDRHWQVIDARDLGEWMVRMAEEGRTGTFNAHGPLHTVTAAELLDTCREVSGSDARFTWVDEDFLLGEQGVVPWKELPLWLPESLDEARGGYEVSVDRAVAAGLTFRPLADTVRDVLEWDRGRPAEERGREVGMSRERERELLEAWKKRRADPADDARPASR